MALDVDLPTPPDLTNRGLPDAPDAESVSTGGDGPESVSAGEDGPESVSAGEDGPESVAPEEADLRRAELEYALGDGAWREGFAEWAEYTDLSAADVRLAETLNLFRALDLFWDAGAERLRYRGPAIPTDWDDRVGDEGSPAALVRSELDDLGRTVAETIVADYVDWGTAAPVDMVWVAETFDETPPGEE
jgi:hypothetical protein